MDTGCIPDFVGHVWSLPFPSIAFCTTPQHLDVEFFQPLFRTALPCRSLSALTKAARGKGSLNDPEWLESPRLRAFSFDESLQCQTKCSRMVGWIFITWQHIQSTLKLIGEDPLKTAPVWHWNRTPSSVNPPRGPTTFTGTRSRHLFRLSDGSMQMDMTKTPSLMMMDLNSFMEEAEAGRQRAAAQTDGWSMVKLCWVKCYMRIWVWVDQSRWFVNWRRHISIFFSALAGDWGCPRFLLR